MMMMYNFIIYHLVFVRSCTSVIFQHNILSFSKLLPMVIKGIDAIPRKNYVKVCRNCHSFRFYRSHSNFPLKFGGIQMSQLGFSDLF